MSDYRAMMRRKLMEQMYDKMSDDEKRTFVQLTMQNRDHNEIMQALQGQNRKLDEIHKAQSWWLDLSSNVVGNALFDGLVWVGSKLFRKL